MSAAKRFRKPSGKKGETQRTTGVSAKKHLGQHFLTDRSVAQRIAETLPEDGPMRVLEIGPGTGVLTGFLMQRPVDLLAVELDAESVRYLEEVFPLEIASRNLPYKSFRVMNADFLKLDLDPLFEGEPFALTGNFPYNISTQIVFRLLQYRHRIPVFSGMFQKEVAQRICAGPGSIVRPAQAGRDVDGEDVWVGRCQPLVRGGKFSGRGLGCDR